MRFPDDRVADVRVGRGVSGFADQCGDMPVVGMVGFAEYAQQMLHIAHRTL